ncbi:MAG: phosphoglucosamine mutase [Candidatus Omnitrophica bacterium]|nr:phosphoglucosamine mutase [Candidatus Omnitrophota bacterium]
MQNLFGTDGIRGKVGVHPLTEDMIYRIGRAAALFVKRTDPHKRQSHHISIAKDTRTTGDMFESQLIKGITSCGVDVVKLGILPTPCSAYLVRELKDEMAIVISASHNDIDDNGLKFFTYRGYKLSPEEEKEIERLASEGVEDEAQADGQVKDQRQAASLYVDGLKRLLEGYDISGYKIAVDCAFGSVSFLVKEAKEALGLDILAINDTPDGNNINQECGSLHPNVISEYVKKEGCSCGFAFDGDGDRVIACDEKGQVLDGDFILAIIGKYLNEKSMLNKNSIATTYMANLGLEMAISQWGGRLIKTEVGDKYVLDKMIRSKLNLGGEQSGHIILFDHTTTGDGLLTALFLLKVMADEKKTLSQLARCMYKFPQILLNIEVDEKKPFDQLPKLAKAIDKCEKALGSKGRLYIRYSGTENKLRIMVEGQNQLQIKELAEDLASVAQEEIHAKARC